MSQNNLTKNIDNSKYTQGTNSPIQRGIIVNKFHKEVIKHILLGNRVLLPNGLSIEIIKHKNDTGKVQPRLGFNYKVRINYNKLKKEKVEFIPALSLEGKIKKVLLHTDFEYKLVTHGYK